jgi:long-chain acyl-CoA synthetase
MDAVRDLTFGQILEQNARSFASRKAVVCGGDSLDYGQLAARVRRLTRALQTIGFGEGDRLLWMGQNCHRALECIIAAANLGGMVCPVNWRGSVPELKFVFDDLAPSVVVVDATMTEQARQLPDDLGSGVAWVSTTDATGMLGYEDLLTRQSDEPLGLPAVDPAAAVCVVYTAAFEGAPNGSMLTQTNLFSQGAVLTSLFRIDSDFRYLVCGPLFHIATLQLLIPTLQAGGVNVFVPKADAVDVCEAIDAERCTWGFLVPPTINEIVTLNEHGKYDLSSFQSFVSLPGWDDMVQPDPSCYAHGGVGQTEVSGMYALAAFGRSGTKTTAGRPVPNAVVAVVDEDDASVAPLEVGEIVVRGPLVHAGYWNRPAINALRFRNDWWHTRDLGYVDDEGIVHFVGPKARMLKSGVENIYPAEVEACLEAHAAVREAAIIGVPDARLGQAVVAIVALDASGAAVTADELIAHCRSRLASYKKPVRVEFVDTLPRSGMAKDYGALDARFGGGNYPGGGTDSVVNTRLEKTSR